MKFRNVVFLMAAVAALTLMTAGQASAAVSVSPQYAFQGTHPLPPGDGGGHAFQGTHPLPPGDGGGHAFQGHRPRACPRAMAADTRFRARTRCPRAMAADTRFRARTLYPRAMAAGLPPETSKAWRPDFEMMPQAQGFRELTLPALR